MSELFGSESSSPVAETAPTASVTAAVEGDGSNQASAERTFTTEQVEKIVKDRLARESKKYAKQMEESKPTKAEKATSNVEEDLRIKLAQYETQLKQREEMLSAFRGSQLRTTVEKKLAEGGCNDPEILCDYFLAKKLVHLDDDDSIVVENADNNLDELVKFELSKRPHLVKPSTSAGVGSKAPGAPKILNVSNVKSMSAEDFAAWKESQGIKANGGKLFG